MERRIVIEGSINDLEKTLKVQVEETEAKLSLKLAEMKQQSTVEFDKKIVEGLKNMETNVTKEIGRSSDSVKKAVVEQERKLDRVCNVIIHNIPECPDDDVAKKRFMILKKLQI